jgi:hypothetical protein
MKVEFMPLDLSIHLLLSRNYAGMRESVGMSMGQSARLMPFQDASERLAAA